MTGAYDMHNNYVLLSLETHLFFGRIMKEHALFLMAGFPCKNTAHIRKADWYRRQFENLLREVVAIADTRVSQEILCSGEVITNFTAMAEQQTELLSGIGIDSRITLAEGRLRAGCPCDEQIGVVNKVRMINQKALQLVRGLIQFKEMVLREVAECRLFTFNYPLLIEHILREARLYYTQIIELEESGTLVMEEMLEIETFWNQIMMEHALFIRGLLDPSEETLIDTADEFAMNYKMLLEEAVRADCRVSDELLRRTQQETLRYREFKATGTQGIIDCQIAGLILPLLADHVLREANHYLRLLGVGC